MQTTFAYTPDGRNARLFEIFHYVFPIALFIAFTGSMAFAVCSLHTIRPPTRKIFKPAVVWLSVGVIGTYVAEAITMLVHSLLEKGWWASEDQIIYTLSSILLWGVLTGILVDMATPTWYVFQIVWTLAMIFETMLLGNAYGKNKNSPTTVYDEIELAGKLCRLTLIAASFIVVWKGPYLPSEKVEPHNDQIETQGLLSGTTAENQGTGYGAIPVETEAAETAETIDPHEQNYEREEREAKARMEKRLAKDGNWWTYAKSFGVFWPMIWPHKQTGLQIRMVIVALCLLADRALNVLVPQQLGRVTDALTLSRDVASPLIQVSIYVFYRWAASGSGISALQEYLWLPVEQHSYRTITTRSYNHVMSLSHEFHSNKSTSDLYVSVSQGRSVTGFIDTILFRIAPMFVDLCVAFIYFYYLFGSYMALTVSTVSVVYMWTTTKYGTKANSIRKDYNTASRKEVVYMWDSLENWQTVKYFNRVDYEQKRYGIAVEDCVKAQQSYYLGLTLVGIMQSMVFTVGLLVASFIAVHQVTTGQKKVGTFVTLLSYWTQLSYPLHFFADFFRKIQGDMVDAERLLELFQTKATVVDRPNAKDLVVTKGEVSFDKVNFAYDERKPTIKNFSLDVPGGSTVALVGQSGGGKSTCLKLLFRFYDVQSGSISIDGQDIRDVTLDSLREHVSVVPQDPQLFDQTIMDNIRYAKLDATDEEIYAVCKAAAVHDKIMSFPDGYHSKVGSRGVKLSGGEFQRIAIARALLKNTKIVLLDEATSMVDVSTERLIQSAFKELAKGRTLFVVAHRLSTIMNSDKIVVIDNGQVTEAGTHKELFEKKGKYYELWQQNSKNTVNEKGEHVKAEGSDLLIDMDDEDVKQTMRALQADNEARKAASTGKSKSVESLRGLSLPPPKDVSCTHSRSESPSRLKPDAAPFIPRSYSASSFYTSTDCSGISRNGSAANLSNVSAPVLGTSSAFTTTGQRATEKTIGTTESSSNSTHKRRRRRRSRKNRNPEATNEAVQTPAAPVVPDTSATPAIPAASVLAAAPRHIMSLPTAVAPVVPVVPVVPVASSLSALSVSSATPPFSAPSTAKVVSNPSVVVKPASNSGPPTSLPPKPPVSVRIQPVRQLAQTKRLDENKPQVPKASGNSQMTAHSNGTEGTTNPGMKPTVTPTTKPHGGDGVKNNMHGKNSNMKRRSRGTLTNKSNSMPTPAASGTTTPANEPANPITDSSVKN